jgi:DNA-binding Lrp family transcriptional regulator
MQLDQLDRALLRLLITEPRVGMREYARVLGIARGTVQARLARLEREGAIDSYAPRISAAALGYPVSAFVELHLAQGRLEAVVAAVHEIPQVLEAYTTTGDGDLLCRVAARDNHDLETVIQSLLDTPGVVRTKTEVALSERLSFRVLPLLVQRSAQQGG